MLTSLYNLQLDIVVIRNPADSPRMAVGFPGSSSSSSTLSWAECRVSAVFVVDECECSDYKYEQKPSVQFVIKWFPVSGGGAPVVVSVVPSVS